MSRKKKILIFIVLFFLFGQLIPIEKTNPDSKAEIVSEKKVKSILERSCYDCHSNKTTWPSYSKIFPISLLIARHVREGREELNFSEWENLSLKKKKTKSSAIIEEIESSEMPPKMYVVFHKDSAISNQDLTVLKKWALKIEQEYEKKEQ